MPQLDVTTYSTQIFWLMLCFGALFLIVKIFIVPNMNEVFSNRLRHINSLLEEADKLTEEAKKIDAETTDFIENVKVDIALNEEKKMREFNEKIQQMQDDLSARNSENSAAALLAIDQSVNELSEKLKEEIPTMVKLICNIIYQRK